MPRLYFDTSALVKFYHVEAGTDEVRRLLGEPGVESFIARLATVEMLSGFASKVRVGAFTSEDYDRLRRRFLADVRKRLVRPIRVLNVHFQAAGELIGKHAMSRQLRTLDALQLAVALHFHRAFPIDHFVCSDQRLCDVAALEGLAVVQP
ncbi:MAG TPA: type II toxin-antitoxin system VapC family toxin [Isosphaeraceae bacterium]|jgi:predicted nucleic acid-binding protein|nr:type II toxin-antitoxin system VapC family toxin [Isosphaeraceae bacterium]